MEDKTWTPPADAIEENKGWTPPADAVAEESLKKKEPTQSQEGLTSTSALDGSKSDLLIPGVQTWKDKVSTGLPSGLKKQGNIDLSNRTIVKNGDKKSTVLSFSIGTDEGEVLIPQVVNGKILSQEDAIRHYEKTGEHLGIFSSIDDANKYAEQLHKDEDARINIPTWKDKAPGVAQPVIKQPVPVTHETKVEQSPNSELYRKYELSQSQYKKANEELNIFNSTFPESGVKSKNLPDQFVFEYESGKKKLSDNLSDKKAIADATRKQISEKINSDVDRIYSEYGKDLMQKSAIGKSIANKERIQEISKEEARKAGLPENGYFATLLKTQLSAKAEWEEIKPEVESKFNEIYKKKYGQLPSEEQEKEFSSRLGQVESIKAKTSVAIEKLASDISKSSEMPIKELGEQYKLSVQELNKSIDSDPEISKYQTDVANSIVQQYQELVNSGKMTTNEANEYLKSEQFSKEVLDKTNQMVSEKYGKQLNESYSNYLKALNQVKTKYNSQFVRQQQEILTFANKEIEKEYAKAQKEYKVSPELEKKYKEAYGQAYKEVSEKKLKGEDSIVEAQNAMVPFYTSTLSSLGSAFKGMGTAFGLSGISDFGERLEANYATPDIGIKKASDIFDATSFAVSSGQLLGRMAPGLAAGAATAVVTKNLNLAAQLAATGFAGWATETSDMVGSMYNEVLGDTGDAVKANTAANKMLEAQTYMMPTYALEGLPFFGNALKKVPTVIGRAVTGAGIEFGTEMVQEIPQGAFEEAIKAEEDLDDFSKYITWEKSKQTMLQMAPVAVLGGAPVLYKGAKDYGIEKYAESQAKSFVLKNDISGFLETSPEQFLFNVHSVKGTPFSKAFISLMYSNGNISADEMIKLNDKVEMFDEYKDFLKKSKIKTAPEQVGFRVFSEYQEAKNNFESEENEDAKDILSERLKTKKQDFQDFFAGNGVNLVQLTMQNGEKYVFSPEEINEALKYENISNAIKNEEIGIAVYAKDGQEAVMKSVADSMELIFQEKEQSGANNISEPVVIEEEKVDVKGVGEAAGGESEVTGEELGQIPNPNQISKPLSVAESAEKEGKKKESSQIKIEGSEEGVKSYDGIFSNKVSSISNKGKGTKEILTPNENRRIVMMSPDDYLTLVREGFNKNIISILKSKKNPDEELIKKYEQKISDKVDENLNESSKSIIRDAVRNGDKLDMPFIFFDKSGKMTDQDGRNRAAYAKEIGEKLIPVLVENVPLTNEGNNKQEIPAEKPLSEQRPVVSGKEESVGGDIKDKKADIERRRQEELFDILSEEDKQIALKIPEGDKRNKWVKTRVSKTTKGNDAIERHNAEDALNTSTDVATRIAAKRKLESNQPFNGGSISDINKVIFKIENDDVLIGSEKLIKDYYDAELKAVESLLSKEQTEPATQEEIEATAKALEGVQRENVDKFVSDFANIDIPFRQENIQAEMDSAVKKQLFPNEKTRRKYAETIYSAVVRSSNFPKILSEAYHKAKADGSNPELVKAVEGLLGKPTEKGEEKVKPIRQLGTGSNVYFETPKYRVNDFKGGKVLLNLNGDEDGGMAISNIEFDNVNEAVKVAEILQQDFPNGIPNYIDAEKYVQATRQQLSNANQTPTQQPMSAESTDVQDMSKKVEEIDKGDVSQGKVGNTEYEVKTDGVYFKGNKLDNPKNLSHKELIEGDIRRRQEEELRAVEKTLEEQKPIPEGTKEGEKPKTDEKGNEEAQGRKEGLLSPEKEQEASPARPTSEKEIEVKFSDKKAKKARFKLIEADELIPSHTQSGGRNPKHTIAGAQPKERSDAGSKAAQDSIAKNPNLAEVGTSPNAYSGAPVINQRGEVIQGNNRSIGLKGHYQTGGKSYKEQLADNAAEYGFTKEQVMGMKNPILVREIEVSDQEATELGNYDVKDLETGGKQRIDPLTTVRKMSAKDKAALSEIIFSDDESTINKSIRDKAKQIAEILKKYLNPAQIQTAFNNAGEPTVAGLADIETIINNMLFDGGPATLPEVFSTIPATVQKGIQKGLKSILGLSEKNEVLRDVQNAVLGYYIFLQSGMSNLNTWMNQKDMFTGTSPKDLFNPFELYLIEKFNSAKTQKEIALIFDQYAELVNGKPGDMFNEAKEGVSKKEAIYEITGKEYTETIKGESERGSEKSAPTEDEQAKAERTRKAQELGFDSPTHLINSVNKRLGTKFKSMEEIPESVLDEIRDQREAERQKQSEDVEGRFRPKNMAQARSYFKNVIGMDANLADLNARLLDARAEGWALRTGRPKSEFYDRITLGSKETLMQDNTVRGMWTRLADKAKVLIGLNNTATSSTFIHELIGHDYLDDIIQSADEGDAQSKQDLSTIAREFKAATGSKLTEAEIIEALRNFNPANYSEISSRDTTAAKVHEWFAKGAEEYFRGNIKSDNISEELKAIFEAFKQMMLSVVNSMIKSGVKLSPPMIEVYGRSFGPTLVTYSEIANEVNENTETDLRDATEKEVEDKKLNEVLGGLKKLKGKGLGQIIGEFGAQNIEQAKQFLANAKLMESNGYSAKEIYLATGWERGKDLKWRYEIPDLRLKINLPEIEGVKIFSLSEIADAPELFSAYPDLRNLKIRITNETTQKNKIYFDPRTNTVSIGSEAIKEYGTNNTAYTSVLLHEAQHAIQYIENFQKGTSPEKANSEGMRKVFNELERKYPGFLDKKEGYGLFLDYLRNVFGFTDAEIQNIPVSFYKRAAGEVEARNVQSRERLTEAQRKESLFSETEDVSREFQFLINPNERSALYDKEENNIREIVEMLSKAAVMLYRDGKSDAQNIVRDLKSVILDYIDKEDKGYFYKIIDDYAETFRRLDTPTTGMKRRKTINKILADPMIDEKTKEEVRKFRDAADKNTIRDYNPESLIKSLKDMGAVVDLLGVEEAFDKLQKGEVSEQDLFPFMATVYKRMNGLIKEYERAGNKEKANALRQKQVVLLRDYLSKEATKRGRALNEVKALQMLDGAGKIVYFRKIVEEKNRRGYDKAKAKLAKLKKQLDRVMAQSDEIVTEALKTEETLGEAYERIAKLEAELEAEKAKEKYSPGKRTGAPKTTAKSNPFKDKVSEAKERIKQAGKVLFDLDPNMFTDIQIVAGSILADYQMNISQFASAMNKELGFKYSEVDYADLYRTMRDALIEDGYEAESYQTDAEIEAEINAIQQAKDAKEAIAKLKLQLAKEDAAYWKAREKETDMRIRLQKVLAENEKKIRKEIEDDISREGLWDKYLKGIIGSIAANLNSKVGGRPSEKALLDEFSTLLKTEANKVIDEISPSDKANKTTPDFAQRLTDLANNEEKFKQAMNIAIAKFVEKNGETPEVKALLKKLESVESPFSAKTLRNAIEQNLERFNLNFRDLAYKYSGLSSVIKSQVVDDLIQNASPEVKQSVADALSKRYDELIAETKQKSISEVAGSVVNATKSALGLITPKEKDFLTKMLTYLKEKATETYSEQRKAELAARGITPGKTALDHLAFAVQSIADTEGLKIWNDAKQAVNELIDNDPSLTQAEKDKMKTFLSDYQRTVFDNVLPKTKQYQIVKQAILNSPALTKEDSKGNKTISWAEIINSSKNNLDVVKQKVKDEVRKLLPSGTDTVLADRIVDNLMQRFEDELNRRKADIVEKQMTNAYDTVMGKIKKRKVVGRRNKAMEVVKLHNTGAFDRAENNPGELDLLANYLGISPVTTEQWDKLRELSESISDAPTGNIANLMIEKLAAEMDKLIPGYNIRFWNAVIFGNMLLGITTSAKNAMGFLAIMRRALGYSVSDLDLNYLKIAARGYNQGDFSDILINGGIGQGTQLDVSVDANGMPVVRLLEYYKPTKWWNKYTGKPYQKLKYTGRVLDAVDSANQRAVSEMAQYYLFKRRLKAEGESSRRRKAYEVMYGTNFEKTWKDAVDQAIIDVEEMGLEGRAKWAQVKRQAWNIIQENRGQGKEYDEAIKNAANDDALYAAYKKPLSRMDGPFTLIGSGFETIFRGLNNIAENKTKPGSVAQAAARLEANASKIGTFPFIRGVANLLDNSFYNIPPFTFIRGMAFYLGNEDVNTIEGRVQKDANIMKAKGLVVGNAIMWAMTYAVIMALKADHDDWEEENPDAAPFGPTGGGPKKSRARGAKESLLPSNSFSYRGRFINYEYLGEYGMMMGAVSHYLATYDEIKKNANQYRAEALIAQKKGDMEEYENLIAKAENEDSKFWEIFGTNLSNFLMDLSFLRLVDKMNWTDPSYDQRVVTNMMLNTFVPFVGISKQVIEGGRDIVYGDAAQEAARGSELLWKQLGIGAWMNDQATKDISGSNMRLMTKNPSGIGSFTQLAFPIKFSDVDRWLIDVNPNYNFKKIDDIVLGERGLTEKQYNDYKASVMTGCGEISQEMYKGKDYRSLSPQQEEAGIDENFLYRKDLSRMFSLIDNYYEIQTKYEQLNYGEYPQWAKQRMSDIKGTMSEILMNYNSRKSYSEAKQSVDLILN